ncbi:hypothetical protein JCM5353_001907 [Sporobolomyces roseus]
MKESSLLRASRPRIRAPIPRKSPSSTTSYATLASSRSTSLALSSRSTMNPSLFLLHVSSLSIASCFIPIIGARHASTRRNDLKEEEPTYLEPLRPEYPIQQPYPPQKQLLRLSSQLRKQIRAAPLDAAFTLRQLHLVNELPRLHLPDSPSTDLTTLLPERWIWRLPATAALHSIFRLLRDPRAAKDSRISDSLLPIALIIARHALEFDTVMWATILKAQGQSSALDWERLLLRARGQAGGEGLAEETAIMTRLNTSERDKRIENEEGGTEEGKKKHDALVRRLWGEGFAEKMENSNRPAPLSARLRSRAQQKVVVDDFETPNRPLPDHLRSFSSIPAQTLDSLVVFLTQQPDLDLETTSTTLSISLSLSNLRVPRSRRALYHSFEFSLKHDRVDLAARFFSDYVDQVQRTGEGAEQASRMLQQRLSPILRPNERAFEATPSRETLSAVATLARALDQQWTRVTAPPSIKNRIRPSPPIALSDLLRLLASFPVAPYAHDIESGTEETRLARQHARVYKMVKHVLRRILETLVERTIHLGSVKSLLGQSWSSQRPSSRRLPLGVLDYNTLISYSLTKLQSAELALLVLERMTRQGITPTAATHSILFTVIAGDSPSYSRTLDQTTHKDSRTIPTLLNHMAKTSNFDELESIVFRILPELDHRSQAPSLLPPTPLTPSPPPLEGRNPYLYTTLLHALACAGRVGLAERVFRNGRWAAELSRAAAAETVIEDKNEGMEGKESQGWVLPPQAFTIMLQMYAAEIKRGRRLERQLDPSSRHSLLPSSTPTSARAVHVRGWGRHALRVFLLRTAQANAPPTSDLTTSTLSPNRRSRFSRLPAFLRADAAPIVALYELEGGSKDEELKSLETAMKDPRTRESLEILFPESQEGEDDEGLKNWRRKQKKDVKEERRSVRSARDRRVARERKKQIQRD